MSPGDRKSGKGEAAAGVEAQRRDILHWASANGVTVVSWHVDLDMSRTTPIEAREVFLEALGSLEDNRAGIFLAQKRDRIAGDVVIAAVADGLVRERGARLVTTDTSDESTPEAAFLRAILDAVSALEVAKIRARTTIALKVKQLRNERTGSVRLGHRLVLDGRHANRHAEDPAHANGCAGCLHIEPEPSESRAIAMAKDLAGHGQSLRRVAVELESAGFVSRTGRRYEATQIARMLSRAAG